MQPVDKAVIICLWKTFAGGNVLMICILRGRAKIRAGRYSFNNDLVSTALVAATPDTNRILVQQLPRRYPIRIYCPRSPAGNPCTTVGKRQ